MIVHRGRAKPTDDWLKKASFVYFMYKKTNITRYRKILAGHIYNLTEIEMEGSQIYEGMYDIHCRSYCPKALDRSFLFCSV